jgi:hypothetical protein
MLKVVNSKKIINVCEFGSNFNEASKFIGVNKFNYILSLFNCVNCLLDEVSLKHFILKHKLKLFTLKIIINIFKKIGFSDIKVFSALPHLVPINIKKKEQNASLLCYA